MSSPSNGGESAIGLKIKQIRESQGLSKTELAARAGIDPSGLTRLEKGERDAHPDTVRKLEDALGLPAGSLRATKIALSRGTEGVRLAFPHTPLAGPIIALASSDMLPDLHCASFSPRSAPDQPFWIPKETSAKVEWPDEIHPYVGSALKKWLDQGVVDLIVAWGALVNWLPDTYERVAQIAYGLSGCTAVGYTRRDSQDPCPADWKTFFEKVAKSGQSASGQTSALPVVIPQGTQQLFVKYQELIKRNHPNINWDLHMVDFAKWDNVEQEVQNLANPSIIFFGWKPHLTKLSVDLDQTFRSTEEQWLGSFFAEDKQPIYMSLDLIHRRDNPWVSQWLSQQRKKTDGLFGLLKAYSRQLPSAENTSADPVILKTIARYLGMEEDVTEAVLRLFVFDLRYYD